MLILHTLCVLLFGLFVSIILIFYAMFSLLFTEILLRLCLMAFAPYLLMYRLILERKCGHFAEIYTNKILTFYRNYVWDVMRSLFVKILPTFCGISLAQI